MADNKSSLVQIAQAVLDEATQTIKVSGALNVSIPPPVGAATEAKQDDQIVELQAIKDNVDGVETALSTIDTKLAVLTEVGYGTGSTALRVQLSDDSLQYLINNLIPQTISPTARKRIVYSSTPVDTSTWVLLLNAGPSVEQIEIFDSSGETLEIGTGLSPAGVTALSYIFPGGNGRLVYGLSSGLNIYVRAVSNNATSGELLVNFYGFA